MKNVPCNRILPRAAPPPNLKHHSILSDVLVLSWQIRPIISVRTDCGFQVGTSTIALCIGL